MTDTDVHCFKRPDSLLAAAIRDLTPGRSREFQVEPSSSHLNAHLYSLTLKRLYFFKAQLHRTLHTNSIDFRALHSSECLCQSLGQHILAFILTSAFMSLRIWWWRVFLTFLCCSVHTFHSSVMLHTFFSPSSLNSNAVNNCLNKVYVLSKRELSCGH